LNAGKTFKSYRKVRKVFKNCTEGSNSVEAGSDNCPICPYFFAVMESRKSAELSTCDLCAKLTNNTEATLLSLRNPYSACSTDSGIRATVPKVCAQSPAYQAGSHGRAFVGSPPKSCPENLF